MCIELFNLLGQGRHGETQFEDFFAEVIFVLVVLAGSAWLIYRCGMKALTHIIGKPLRVRVLSMQVEVDHGEHGTEIFTYHVAIDYRGNSYPLVVSKFLFGKLKKDEVYTVKGVLWADDHFTFVGVWTRRQPMSNSKVIEPPTEVETAQSAGDTSAQQSVLEALCCVMAADGQITKDEKRRVIRVCTNLRTPIESNEVTEYISSYVSRVRSLGYKTVLNEAIQNLAEERIHAKEKQNIWRELHHVAEIDGEMDERERRVLERFRVALRVE